MLDRPLASFRIDITSVREHTWQGRVQCGAEIRSFESELELLRTMIELVPGLATWSADDFQEQEETP